MKPLKYLLSALCIFTCLNCLASVPDKFNAADKLHFLTTKRHLQKADTNAESAAFFIISENSNPSDLDKYKLRRSAQGDCALLVKGPLDSIIKASQEAFVKEVYLPRKFKKSNNLIREEIGTQVIWEGQENLPEPFTGKGVVCGLFDTGIDPHHIAFIDSDGKTRVKRIYLFEDEDGSFSKYETEKEIESFVTDNPDDPHGTHVACTMAGFYDGKGIEGIETTDKLPFSGVAKDSDIAIGCGGLYDANILEGVAQIIDYAKTAGKPCVVNLSIGNVTGPHDGSEPFCRILGEYAKDAVIVMSAGNDGSTRCGISYDFTTENNEVKTIIFPSSPTDVQECLFDIWSRDRSTFEISALLVDSETGIILEDAVFSRKDQEYLFATPATGETPVNKSQLFNDNFSASYMAVAAAVSNNRQNYAFQMRLKPKPSNGGKIVAGIRIRATQGHCDAPFEGSRCWIGAGGFQGWYGGDSKLSMSSIAYTPGVIVAGAYTSRLSWPNIEGDIQNIKDFYSSGSKNFVKDQIAPFSAYADTLPHIAAPGAAVISAFPGPFCKETRRNQFLALATDKQGNKHYYGIEWGTSMSAPAIAGSIAQWLEADPSLTGPEIIGIIKKTAKIDEFVLSADNPLQWGAGKFDALAGLKEVLKRQHASVAEINSAERCIFKPLPDGCEIFVAGANQIEATVHDLSGRCIAREKADGEKLTIYSASYPPGVYIVVCGSNNFKFCR